MSEKLKIAIFTETFLPQVNGVVRTIEKIVRHLEDHGHEVKLFAIGDGEDHYSKTEVIRLEGVPFSFYKELYIVKPEDKILSKLSENDISQTPLAALQALIPSKHSKVEKALEEFKPDLIHLATPVTLGAIGIYYVEKLGLPCLSTFHTDLAAYAPMYQVPYMEEFVNAATKMIYSRTDRILVPSRSSQKQLKRLGLKNIGVFGRGVDHVLFNTTKSNKEILKNYNLDPSKTTLVYVGRLAEEKSLPELIFSYKELKKRYANIQLLLIGDGPARQSLETSLKDTTHYAFAGLKKGEELAELFSSADIFAFPSKTETFGQVVQEAMACGLPVVGYDSPGVRDLVQDTFTGFLADDQDSFTCSLEKLFDKDLRKRMSVNARLFAETRSWESILNGLLDEYKKLINSKLV
jgi:glycosyltransferase involved in cell wall biosynthesis